MHCVNIWSEFAFVHAGVLCVSWILGLVGLTFSVRQTHVVQQTSFSATAESAIVEKSACQSLSKQPPPLLTAWVPPLPRSLCGATQLSHSQLQRLFLSLFNFFLLKDLNLFVFVCSLHTSVTIQFVSKSYVAFDVFSSFSYSTCYPSVHRASSLYQCQDPPKAILSPFTLF